MTSVSAIAVPIIIAIVGNNYTSSIKDRELRIEYVRIAVDILGSEPTDTNRPIRGWAVDVINSNSDVKLDTIARRALVDSVMIFPAGGGPFGEGTQFNIYELRSSDSRTIDYVNGGDELKVIHRDEIWSFVETDRGIRGWIRNRFIDD